MTLRLISQIKLSTKLLNASTVKLAESRYLCNLKREFHLSAFNLYADPMQLKMPALSPTMTEGQIVKWHKKEGDKISPGDVLFEVQTDKAVMAFELEEEGILAKILTADESKPIQVGSLVALMVSPGEDWKNIKVPTLAGVHSPSTPPAAISTEQPKSDPISQVQQEVHIDHDLKVGPATRNLILQYRVDPTKLKGTGPHGRILKGDVKAYIEQNNLVIVPDNVKAIESATAAPISAPVVTAAASAVPAQSVAPTIEQSSNRTVIINGEHELDYEDIELSNMRKVIAKRLLFSKNTIPHSYARSSCVIDKIIAIRKEMIKNNQKVSINDFIIKAIALALKLVPELNSNYDEKSESYKLLSTVDVSVAVATDKGLITPIVKNADRLSVAEISENVKSLAEKARNNKLQPHEFQGGSFSISNLGMFGISYFTAVINPPQIGILAVGKSESKFNSEMKEQTEISFNLSFDERGINMDRAIKFLNTLNYFLLNPALLIEPKQEF